MIEDILDIDTSLDPQHVVFMTQVIYVYVYVYVYVGKSCLIYDF